MELAIDTSTKAASIALSDKGNLIAQTAWHAGHNHTVELAPKLVQILEQNNATIRDIQAVSVARGPGSFNGLRVGLATAKGLAFALGIPVVGISTLEVIAYPYAELGGPICPIIQAGRGEIAAAVFRSLDGIWTKLAAEHVTIVEDLCSGISEKTILCGEITADQLEQFGQRLAGWAVIKHDSNVPQRAGYLAKLGWCRIEAEDFDDASALQPLYLKKPSITSPKRRKHDALSHMRARSQ